MYSCICTSSASTADCNTRRSLTWSALSTFTAAVAAAHSAVPVFVETQRHAARKVARTQVPALIAATFLPVARVPFRLLHL